MTLYRTRSGDMIDAICYKYYGGQQSGAVEIIYEANRGLAFLGAILPAGLVIELPDIDIPAETPIKLWD